MKNFLLSVVLLCSLFGYSQNEISTGTASTQELLARLNSLGHQAGDIHEFFTTNEIAQLQSYFRLQSQMDINLGTPVFSPNGGASIAYGAETAAMLGFVSFDPGDPAVLTTISAGSGTTGFEGAGAISNDNPSVGYAIDTNGVLYSIDVATGAYTNEGNVGILNMNGMEFDPTDGTLYAITGSDLYTIDTDAVSATLVGSLGLNPGDLAIALAIDGDGNAYTYELVSNMFYSVDLATGATTMIGDIGFDANFGQGMCWDSATDTVYMAAFNFTTFQAEWRSVNLATGATTMIGAMNPGVLSQVAWASIPVESTNPEGNCDLEGELADPSLGGPVWDRPLEDGSDLSAVGIGVSYHVYGPFTVDAAGSYEINDTQDGWDGIIFIYSGSFDPMDPLTNYVAGDDDGPGGIGTSQIITDLATGTEYFLVTTAFSPEDFGPFVNTIDGPGTVTCDGGTGPGEGCLEADPDLPQWPTSTFTPACVGTGEVIATNCWTGEYSMVQVTAGTEYILSSSVATDFITISDENGTEVYATGTGTVTWTADATELIRFYLHLDSECAWGDDVNRSRIVQCGDVPPPPTGSCEEQEVPSNNLENGLFFGGDTDQSLAVDVIVGDEGFPVYGIDINAFTDGNTDLSFNVTFFEDDGGLPGAEHAATACTVISSDFIGNAFGFDVYNYIVAFDDVINLDANTTYWMQVDSDGLAWEATSASFYGEGLVFSNTNTGGVWTLDPATELVYDLICEELGTSDMSSFDFSYYPNPVKDVLNIDAKKAISKVTVNNLAGQQVLNKVDLTNGQVDVTSLAPGVYVFRVTLEGGQVETFKIIKK